MVAMLDPNGKIPAHYLPTAGDNKRIRDLYMQDWTVQVEHDHHDIHDPFTGQVTRRVVRSEPKIHMEFRGKPVTIDERPHGHMRIAIWMPGEAMRTQPLLEETFERGDFYELSKKAFLNARDQSMIFSSDSRGMGIEQAFMVEWCRANYKAILEQEDKRSNWSHHWPGPNGPDDFPVIRTEDFTGEDGRRYTRTIPMSAEERHRYRQEEALRKQREEARLARIEREQAEMEAIPNFGAW